MARRDLLTDSERHALFNVPAAREDLARPYILSSRDFALIAERRGDRNQAGFAVQLALMRHPGFGFTLEVGAPGHLVAFMAEQIDVSASAFDTYAARPATASVHARQEGGALGLRMASAFDHEDLAKELAWSCCSHAAKHNAKHCAKNLTLNERFEVRFLCLSRRSLWSFARYPWYSRCNANPHLSGARSPPLAKGHRQSPVGDFRRRF